MYHDMNNWNGSNWIWMVPMMLLFIAVLGGVIYAAVRLALGHPHHGQPPVE